AAVDSEETLAGPLEGPASFAIDGNQSTFWHTAWVNSNPPHPHAMTLNLGGVYPVNEFWYLPRQDGNPNGTILDFLLETSLDGSSFTFAASGTWTGDPAVKQVNF